MIPSNEETAALVQRARAGDQGAFATLLDRHAVRLLAYVRRAGGQLLRADFDVDDVFQLVAAEAWHHLPTFEDRGPGSFYRWMLKLAEHAIQDRVKYLAAKGRGAARHLESQRAVSASGAWREPVDTQTSVSVVAARREEVRDLERALDRLLPDARRVIEMQMIEAKSMSEIASELGLAKSTVWERVNSALTELKKTLGDVG